MAFVATQMDSLQSIADMLHRDIFQLKAERLDPDIINFGLTVNHLHNCIDLLVVKDDCTDSHPICFRYELYNGMSITMAAELIIGRVREIVKFYPPVATVMDGADEYDDIMQAQEIMNAL